MSEVSSFTLVIPAYNEADRLPESIEKILQYVDGQSRQVDMLLVDDGSTDGTAQVARETIGDRIPLRIINNQSNRGKGYSVRRGMCDAQGECALFSDADLSTPIHHAEDLLEAIEGGADIAIGSRILPESQITRHQPFWREGLGRAFGWVVGTMILPGIYDSQCGFKCFRRSAARNVFSRTTLDKWAFDVEALLIADRLGYDIAQIPVQWQDDAATKVRVATEGPQMLVDLFRAKWRHRGLKDQNNGPA